MLTREHLLYRIRKGSVRPSFVERSDPDLISLAQRLITTVTELIGIERRAIEAALRATANAHQKPKVGRGLCKLLLDRMDFGEAGEESEDLRSTTFPLASQVLRSLADGSTFADYEAALASRLDLPRVRERLFADLAEHRPLLSFRAISAEALLDRYNLGLAQGLLLYADQIRIELDRPDLLEVRRVLRWLKFCRLVAYLEKREDQRLLLVVEGPGAILDMQKKYGLQLANFLGAVPLLSRFRLAADVRLPRKVPCTLQLSEEDPLVSPFAGAPGHVPDEVRAFIDAFADEEWTIDPMPDVRPVGVADIAVPDFMLRHKNGEAVAVELFHRWHRGVLLRRMEALASKPDPSLVLGVDRSLVDQELEKQIAASDRMFVFNAFPSKKALEKVLMRTQ